MYSVLTFCDRRTLQYRKEYVEKQKGPQVLMDGKRQQKHEQ